MGRRSIHIWNLLEPPLGASIWVDRTEKWSGRDVAFHDLVPRYYNLALVLKGQVELEAFSGIHIIPKGWMFISRPNEKYTIQSHNGNACAYLRLRFCDGGAGKFLQGIGFSQEALALPAHNFSSTLEVFNRLFACYSNRETRDPYQALSLIYKLAEVSSSQRLCTEEGHLWEREVVAQAESLMAPGSGQDMTISDIASTMNVSPATLLRYFHKHKGSSVVDVQTRLRIEFACHLLSVTELKTESIALRSGFHCPKYFYRCFKRVIGISPTKYRNENPKNL